MIYHQQCYIIKDVSSGILDIQQCPIKKLRKSTKFHQLSLKVLQGFLDNHGGFIRYFKKSMKLLSFVWKPIKVNKVLSTTSHQASQVIKVSKRINKYSSGFLDNLGGFILDNQLGFIRYLLIKFRQLFFGFQRCFIRYFI